MDVYVHNKFLADVIKQAVCGASALCGLEELTYLQLVFQYRHFFVQFWTKLPPGCRVPEHDTNTLRGGEEVKRGAKAMSLGTRLQ